MLATRRGADRQSPRCADAVSYAAAEMRCGSILRVIEKPEDQPWPQRDASSRGASVPSFSGAAQIRAAVPAVAPPPRRPITASNPAPQPIVGQGGEWETRAAAIAAMAADAR